MIYRFEDCVLDPDRRELRRGAGVVAVEPQVFDLILYLIRNRARVVTQDDLFDSVWEGRIVSESTLRSRMNAARTALGDNGDAQRLIRTLPRKGFRFVGTVHEDVVPAQDPAGIASADGAGPADGAGQGVAVSAPTRERTALANAPDTEPARAIVAAHPAHGDVAAPRGAISIEPPRRRGRLAGAGLVAFSLVATIAAWQLWPREERPAGPPFDAAAVPLVSDETRRALATYPQRRDARALAISANGIAIADGARDMQTARQQALRECAGRAKRPCRIYAEGDVVVWSPDTLPLPARRDLRVEPLALPLTPADIPTIKRENQQDIAERYMTLPNHKALALASGGTFFARERATRAEAIRLAVEGCADRWQRPCLILSVDGQLTVRIPRAHKIAGLFLPSIEADIPVAERERIGEIYGAAEWRAVARGRKAWHATGGAASENAAAETVLASCAQADSDCRLFAIGNFRVLDER